MLLGVEEKKVVDGKRVFIIGVEPFLLSLSSMQ